MRQLKVGDVDRLVSKIAWHYSKKYFTDYEDTNQEAWVGAIEANAEYTTTHNTKLTTFMHIIITRRLNRSCIRNMQRRQRTRNLELDLPIDYDESVVEYPPNPEEMLYKARIYEELRNYIRNSKHGVCVSAVLLDGKKLNDAAKLEGISVSGANLAIRKMKAAIRRNRLFAEYMGAVPTCRQKT